MERQRKIEINTYVLKKYINNNFAMAIQYTQLGQGDVIMSSCREIAGQLIMYVLHIAVRGA
jgi:hypothetical protein